METLFQKKERCSKKLLEIAEKAFKECDLITVTINDHTLGVYTSEGNFKISAIMKKEGCDFSYEIEQEMAVREHMKKKEKLLKKEN